MHLSETLQPGYTRETHSALAAQRTAELIAFGPVVFQVSRLMIKYGILEMLNRHELTVDEVAQRTGLSTYAVKCLLEASLTIGTVLVNTDTDKYRLSKTGWFLLNDPATRVNLNFNHDVNYQGMFYLDEALTEGRPAGLATLGNWPTIYEGLSHLPPDVRKSWFDFDHFYSDSAFDKALEVVFAHNPKYLLDVGGNTGKWAMKCVTHSPEVEVTIVDLPGQLAMMQQQTAGKPGADRIKGVSADLLSPESSLPNDGSFDAVWMSQFLDCFSEEQAEAILRKAVDIMQPHTRLYIMETLWDRQRFDTAAFCLTQVSIYFTVMANGNSKMFHSDDLLRIIHRAGLTVETIHDNIGQGHSIVVCRKP